MCPIPYKEFSSAIEPEKFSDVVEYRKIQKAALNTCMLSATLRLVGADLKVLEDIIIGALLKRKGQAVVDANIMVANAGYEHAAENFHRI